MTRITWQKVPSHEDATVHWAADHWPPVCHWEIQDSAWSTGPCLTGPWSTGPLGCLTQNFQNLTEKSHQLDFRDKKQTKTDVKKTVKIVKSKEGKVPDREDFQAIWRSIVGTQRSSLDP